MHFKETINKPRTSSSWSCSDSCWSSQPSPSSSSLGAVFCPTLLHQVTEWCLRGLALTFQLPCSLPVLTLTLGCQSVEAVAMTHFLLSELEMCCLHGPYCPSGLLVCEGLSGPMLVAWKGQRSHCTEPRPGADGADHK